MKNQTIAVGVLLLTWLSVAQGEEETPLRAVRCGWLIDGTGAEPVRNAVVVIQGDRIKEITQRVPKGAEVVDLSDRYVLPGLIDCHTHVTMLLDKNWRYSWTQESAPFVALRATKYVRDMLEAGFTTCRNVGASEFVDVALRDAIEQGYIVGPRLFVAAHAVGMTGGHCDLNGFRPDLLAANETIRTGRADGVAEVRKAVRYQIKYGADVIKTCATGGVLSEGDAVGATQYSFEELRTLVEEAAMAGRKVAAHAHGTEGIKLAIRAGVASIEHGSILDDEAIELMIEHGTYLVPTRYVGDYVLMLAEKGLLPNGIEDKARSIGPLMQDSLQRAVKAGVKIAFGTDVGVFPHGDAAKEFRVMVEAGMTPMHAIQAATRNAADLIGELDNFGTIEAGKYADLIAVEASPLEDITRLENVSFVMKGGTVYKDSGR